MSHRVKQSVFSPMPTGSGALIIHRDLKRHLNNYHLKTFDPKFAFLPTLLALLKRSDCGVVHSTVDLMPYLSDTHQSRIATLHNYYLDKGYMKSCDPVRRAYYRTFLRYQFLKGMECADRIISVSKTTRDLLLRDIDPPVRIRKKVSTITNGVDCQKFKPGEDGLSSERVTFLFSGNPSARKGWPFIVNIADELPENCEILCTTGLRDVKKLPKLKNIKYLSRLDHEQMPQLYRQVDALLLPSYREGLSLALLEGMASGLPVVGFNVSSMPEALDHLKGGYLVEPGNGEQLLGSMVRLAQNPHQRLDFGAYNREKCVQAFNLKRMLAEYQQVFAA